MSVSAGIGLKPAHYGALLTEQPALGFLEVHAENYMGDGGPPHRYLDALAQAYSLSFHGVGMSLGGSEELDHAHLMRWRELINRYEPALVSEHVAWSSHAGIALNELLPIPYSEESLRVICEHIDQMQNALRCRILIENPSRYLDFRCSEMSEPEFLVRAAQRTGCGLLLDINNVYVSSRNQGEDPQRYLESIPERLVEEIHLAGHAVRTIGDQEILIDDHGSRVAVPVRQLYCDTIARIGRRPTLVEWDTDVPELDVLLDEARRADDAAVLGLLERQSEKRRHALSG